MHPVTRIAGLVALAIGLATAGPAPLIAVTLMMGLLAGRQGLSRTVFLEPLRRLRWLLLSITLLYAFLLPGDPLLPGWTWAAPSRQGLLEGLLRCWMLCLMAGAAGWLMATTPREALMGALYWIARPLEYVGVDAARFCLRLVLTLEYALRLRRDSPAPKQHRSGSYTERAARLARSRLRRAEAAAAEAEPGPVSIPLSGAPPWWQWCVPAALLIALLALQRLSFA